MNRDPVSIVTDRSRDLFPFNHAAHFGSQLQTTANLWQVFVLTGSPLHLGGIGLARAMTVSMIYPLMSAVMAAILLGEPLTARLGVGSLVTHTYARPGDYTAVATVADNLWPQVTSQATVPVHVAGAAPSAPTAARPIAKKKKARARCKHTARHKRLPKSCRKKKRHRRHR